MKRTIQKKTTFTGILLVLVAIILLTYTAYDAFYLRPHINQRVDTVSYQFNELKVYLDSKLPEVDSLLILHTQQINEQNKQINELNELTKVLKTE